MDDVLEIIIYAKWVNVLIDVLAAAKRENPKFEPRFSEADKGKTETFASVRPILLALQDDFRTINWAEEYPYPTLVLKDLELLLV